jgi:acyl carrier protein
MNDPSFEAKIIALIADTFSADPKEIGRETVANDVDGWDSLGHSILLARLSQKLGIDIGEEIASGTENVGQLVDQLQNHAAGSHVAET